MTDHLPSIVNRRSFMELHARERALCLLDSGTGRELAGPFDRIESPWLPMQGIVPESDDGCVVIKGSIAQRPVVVIALEGAFQGGSVGEVSGAKISTALELAERDSLAGKPTAAVLLLETGGVRLQEANLGLAAVAEIVAGVLSLRRLAPVIALIAGPVGCFGGMSLAAGASSYVIMTPEARLGLNGAEVIEQESGTSEFDPSDRTMIWATQGGEHRVAIGLADLLLEDDAEQLTQAVREYVLAGPRPHHRSENVAFYRDRVAALDPSKPLDLPRLRAQFIASQEDHHE